MKSHRAYVMGIAFFEIYSGDHISAVADRIQNHALPFFSENLSFEQPAESK